MTWAIGAVAVGFVAWTVVSSGKRHEDEKAERLRQAILSGALERVL